LPIQVDYFLLNALKIATFSKKSKVKAFLFLSNKTNPSILSIKTLLLYLRSEHTDLQEKLFDLFSKDFRGIDPSNGSMLLGVFF
jgi:hypothetical protein